MDAIWRILPFTREPSLLEKAWMAARYPIDLVASPVKAIVSIPAISFLVIPAFSSYGTSVNLLFFYMTWAILIRSNDPIKIEIYGTLGIRFLFYIFPSLLFLAFDSASPSLAVNMKEHGKPALPMSVEQGGRRGPWWRVGLVSIGNVFLSLAVQIGLELFATQGLHLQSLLRISTTVPLPWSIVKDLFLGLILREALTYALHRYVLHSDNSMLADMHESWQHRIQIPYSLVAHYDHPVTYLVHVFLPMFLPAMLLRFHILTYQIYLILVSVEETFTYSGYNVLPSAFILGGIARRQEQHFSANGDGNYGCFGLADTVMGTSLGTDLVEDVIDEAEDGEIGKKAQSKPRDVRKRASKSTNTRARSRNEDNKEVEDERRRPRRNRSSPVRQGSRRDRHGDIEDTNDEELSENIESPIRKSTRAQKNNDRKAMGEINPSGDEPRPETKSTMRKGNQRRQVAKKRGEEDG